MGLKNFMSDTGTMIRQGAKAAAALPGAIVKGVGKRLKAEDDYNRKKDATFEAVGTMRSKGLLQKDEAVRVRDKMNK